MENKIELLRDIIEDSKRFEFVEDEILKIESLNGKKKIYINFIGLIESLCEYDIYGNIKDRVLLNEKEYEKLGEK